MEVDNVAGDSDRSAPRVTRADLLELAELVQDLDDETIMSAAWS